MPVWMRTILSGFSRNPWLALVGLFDIFLLFVDDDDNPGWIFIDLESRPVRYYDFRLKDWYFLD